MLLKRWRLSLLTPTQFLLLFFFPIGEGGSNDATGAARNKFLFWNYPVSDIVLQQTKQIETVTFLYLVISFSSTSSRQLMTELLPVESPPVGAHYTPYLP